MGRESTESPKSRIEGRLKELMDNDSVYGFAHLEQVVLLAVERIDELEKEVAKLQLQARGKGFRTPSGGLERELEKLRAEVHKFREAKEITLEQLNLALDLLQQMEESIP